MHKFYLYFLNKVKIWLPINNYIVLFVKINFNQLIYISLYNIAIIMQYIFFDQNNERNTVLLDV